jgi:hypothetical protein
MWACAKAKQREKERLQHLPMSYTDSFFFEVAKMMRIASVVATLLYVVMYVQRAE